VTASRKWRTFWEGKASPLHQSDSAAFYARHAAELNLLFDIRNISSVLEIGCGNGAMYSLLGFDKVARYRGVDFSASMLEEFTRRHGGLDVFCGDGSDYRDDQSYDLIFSNGVIQYFNRQNLARHIMNARAMMHKDSTLVCGSIPWRALRSRYLSGALSTDEHATLGRYLRNWASRLLGRDKMGHWYDIPDLKQLADQADLSMTFYGSVTYPYRCHAVMQII
jgi:cyclopropane fatty-acyl-phospholipid synthase-like methyltransferase